ncbi:FkbM family methyltransferase [Halobacterium hubeiense]|uniref:FkbM family methyltransferase n=1 Tax=Halobacterium hubeiense TaxID=1407499 RepID=UPI003C7887A2
MDIEYLRSNLRVAFWKSFRQFLSRPVEVTIGDTSAKFIASELPEYQRCSSLGGERAIVRDILSHLKSDDTFYDIGANIGTHSCFVGRSLQEGTLIPFEPFPPNTHRLEENLELNDINPSVEGRALSDHDGTVSLHLTGEHVAEGGNSLVNRSGTEKVIQVETVTGDTFVYEEGHPAPDIVKLDVEGAEKEVLRGMRQVLNESECRAIYYESHQDGDDVHDLLRSVGFTIDTLQSRGSETHYRAEKRV